MRHLIAAALLAGAAQAQLPPTTETIDVNVVEIDVVVLDAQGKPVPGLERKDFDLRVAGRKRTITNFYAVNRRPDDNPGSKAAPNDIARRDYLVLFIDELHLNQHEKKRALDALRTFVQQHVRPGTAAMLVESDDRVHILKRFTEDPAELVGLIDALERRPAGANEYDRERRELLNFIDEQRRICQDPNQARACAAETIPQRIQALGDLAQHRVEETMRALDQTAGLLAGLDGRRMLVYVSDGLPMQPGAEIFQYFKPEEFITNGNFDIMRVLQQSQPLDAMRTNMNVKFVDLARRTAGAGVQFFAIDARGVQGFDEGVESSAASSRLDSSLIRSNLQSTTQLLADETGGQAITDTNDMNLAFDKLDEHLSSYYSLGFVSEGNGREDDISVSVKRRGLTVRAAKHARQRTAREEIADRVRAALYARVESNPLGARVAFAPTASGVKASIRVPTAKLSIFPGQQSAFTVFVSMLDEEMRETPVRMFVHRIGSTELQESVQFLTLNAVPGTYTVSMAISDSYSMQVSYVQQDVTILAK